MSILALDLGTKTGYAIVDDGRVLLSGVWNFTREKNEHYGHMFFNLREQLKATIWREGIDMIAYELAHHRAGPATRIGVGMNAIVLLVCASCDIPMREVHTATLKKHATGSGRASKDEMIVKAREYLDREPVDDNEADAVLIGMWMVDYMIESEVE